MLQSQYTPISMRNIRMIQQLSTESRDLKRFFSWGDRDVRRKYDSVVLDTSEMLYGRRSIYTNRRFDSASTLSLYEMFLDLDKRVVKQMLEESALRGTFYNAPGVTFFPEYTGISIGSGCYVVPLLETTGSVTPEAGGVNTSGMIRPSTDPNTKKTITASLNSIKRDIASFEEAFKLSIFQLEMSAAANLSLPENLTTAVVRDLALQEQQNAFYYAQNVTSPQPESQGLFNNNAISDAITWEAGPITDTATTGRAIIDEFVRIRAQIVYNTLNVYASRRLQLCVLVNPFVLQNLMRTYSDFTPEPPLPVLTRLGFLLGEMPIIPTNMALFYYKDPEIVEISTAELVKALPQSYNASDTSWTFPFRNITAGLTVKKPQAMYFVSGLDPTAVDDVDDISNLRKARSVAAPLKIPGAWSKSKTSSRDSPVIVNKK